MVQPVRPARSPARGGRHDSGMHANGKMRFRGDLESLLRGSGLGSTGAVLDRGDARRVDALPPGRRGRSAGAAGLFRLPPLQDGRVPFVNRFEAASLQEVDSLAAAAKERSDRYAAAGLLAPAPSAWGFRREGAGRTEGFVLFAAPAGSTLLDSLLRRGLFDRRPVLEGPARALARMHAAGIGCPGLFSWNILVGAEGEAAFLGLETAFARRGRRSSAVRDLAALSATIEATACSRSDRLRFLGAYLSHAGRPSRAGSWKALWRRIEKEERRFRRSGVFPALLNLVERSGEGGCLTVAEEWWPGLLGEGFGAPDDFTDLERESIEVIRTGADRSNCVLSTTGGRFYLKVHRFKQRRRQEPPGLREWRNNLRLMRCGLPVAPPAVWGRSGGCSFFASRDEGGKPLDVLLGPVRSGDAALRRLLAREAGRLVGAFHRAGFFHRDLYACHLVLRANGLCFIDLQRMEDGYFPRRRGVVKDLAALLYSSFALSVTNADRMRFFKAYRGGGRRLAPSDRKLIAAVRAKARRIAGHDRRTSRAEGAGS